LSFTVTLKTQLAVLPLASIAVQVMGVVPRANRVPDGGTHAVVAPGQLSLVVATKLTIASQRPASVFVTMFAGHTAMGSSPSCTVTVKLHRLVFPLASVAVQFTAVTPLINVAPEGGAQITVVPLQLSVALAANVTTASQRPTAVLVAIFAGQLATGGWLSFTVTLKTHDAVLPLASVAVHVTGVVPRANRVPEGGTHVVVAPGQLSLAVAAKLTIASQRPASVLVTTFAGHTTAGGSVSCTVTVKLHRLVFPLASVAVQFTAVTPLINVAPEGGAQITVVPLQLSVADAVNVTTASQRPAVVFVTIFVGQTTTGASRSCTITRNAHVAVFPLVSCAVQFTTFVPFENLVPDGGAHVTVAIAQLSVAVAANVATASHRPVCVLIVSSAGHVITGRSASTTVTGNVQSCAFPELSTATQ